MTASKRYSVVASSAAALFLGIMLLAGCSKSEETPAQSGPPKGVGGGMMGGPGAKVADSATAEEIFQQKCQGCHGKGGSGGNAPKLTTLASAKDEDLTKILSDGKGKMPAFKAQLSEDQIKSVVTYIKGLK